MSRCAPAVLPRLLAVLLGGLLAACSAPARLAGEPLPSWTPGPGRAQLLAFIDAATDPDSPGWIAPDARLAVFDHDGTLLVERPRFAQAEFVYARIRELAPQHPEWRRQQPWRAVLEGDSQWLAAQGLRVMAKLMNSAQAGLSQDDYAALAAAFWREARDPHYGRAWHELVYAPMQELIALLLSRGFDVYIVSAGGSEFIRAVAGEAWGLPPERVIGSRGKTRLREVDGRLVVWRAPGIESLNVGPRKALNIRALTGRRPVLAVGNSDSDLAMLRYAAETPGGLAVVLEHDDARREFAYRDGSERLRTAAAEGGWLRVSMARDFRRVFGWEEAGAAP
ncbi:MAG: haloacid dehalogenase-like hydrolase [Gammaproteobacteria bacterium]|nr:MAG: haloacid dehalogenase-like hydrolase [Gammaproteobacteria bacterium]